MPVLQFPLPDPGEGLVEAEIVTWHVAAGDTVEVNQPVLEIETAKSLVELPIPWEGKVVEILVPEGETVEVGTPIVTIEVGGDVDVAEAEAAVDGAAEVDASTSESPAEEAAGDMQASAEVAPPADDAPAATAAEGDEEPQQKTLVGYGPTASSTSRRARRNRPGAGERALAAPATRGFAKAQGVDIDEVKASRDDGVVSRDDVSAAAGASTPRHMRPDAPTAPAAPSAVDAAAAARSTAPERPVVPAAAPAASGGLTDERLPIKGVRKVTAQAMVSSAFTAPHVSEFYTVDMTRTMEFVKELQRDREFRDVKVTPNLIVARACLIAMKREPMMNALWDEANAEIVMRSEVNLGIAAATDRGLLVPNIKDAGRFGLLDLAREMAKLIDIARHGKPSPAILNGGTFTISNIGVFGVDAGTPIIKPGESGILAIGAVRPMPWVVTNDAGEQDIAIRQVAQLSLSFDHRLIDGDVGSRFLSTVGQILENPAKGIAWA
ncbi:2-oxo acid dehydrogenase subunit E2 [Dermacoccus abyssi]|uniref:Dihydrolipoamide acetyltransferase component of pyruvate dehydrogenase complex n=1 Tax=Dermacoccus abyssi TaxID=322596 RepID=A0ABX5Z5Z1_9MICO|nr:2-oxo acid dehydrogenase subunit E2 [Dermacoccus abyssi]